MRAPPILITSSVTLSEGYTDNPRNTSQTLSDSLTRLTGYTNISFDTVRLQGQLSSSLNYDKYARANDQSALTQSLLGYGLATIVRDHFFIDARASITQLAQNGGVGLTNSPLIPPSQQTQALTTSLSPIVRGTIGDYLAGELRYNLGLNLFENGTLSGNPGVTTSGSTGSNSLSNTLQNEATLSLATGPAFGLFGSKLTLDLSQVASQSPAKSTQLKAFDDVEYQINPRLAVLARAGYEDIRYPLQPGASTKGMIWRIGGRLSPAPGDYLVLRYGLENGFYGAEGALRYQLTAATTLLASLQNGLSSSQEQILNSLNTSQLDANGTIVDQYSGLPSALSNPEFGYASNSVFRTQDTRIGIQTVFDRDTFGVFGTVDRRSALGAATGVGTTAGATSGTDTSLGVNFNWSRSVTPLLTGMATLGYAREIANDTNTLTADLNLTYTMNEWLTGTIHYQFVNVTTPTIASSTFTGPYHRNLIEFGLRRSF